MGRKGYELFGARDTNEVGVRVVGLHLGCEEEEGDEEKGEHDHDLHGIEGEERPEIGRNGDAVAFEGEDHAEVIAVSQALHLHVLHRAKRTVVHRTPPEDRIALAAVLLRCMAKVYALSVSSTPSRRGIARFYVPHVEKKMMENWRCRCSSRGTRGEAAAAWMCRPSLLGEQTGLENTPQGRAPAEERGSQDA